MAIGKDAMIYRTRYRVIIFPIPLEVITRSLKMMKAGNYQKI